MTVGQPLENLDTLLAGPHEQVRDRHRQIESTVFIVLGEHLGPKYLQAPQFSEADLPAILRLDQRGRSVLRALVNPVL